MSKIAIAHPTERDSIKWVPGPAQKKIGELPDHQVAVVRKDGTRVARVSRGASASVAQRLLGRPVTLGRHEGKDAWIEKQDPVAKQPSAMRAALDHAASLRAAKGSVTRHPTKPQPTARPKR
jgi:hypothetical protein